MHGGLSHFGGLPLKGGSRGSYGSANMYGGPTMDNSFSSLGSAPFKNTLSLAQTKMNF